MGNRGFVELHNEQGLNLITMAMGLVFVFVIVGSIVFKLKMDQDRARRKSIRDERNKQAE